MRILRVILLLSFVFSTGCSISSRSTQPVQSPEAAQFLGQPPPIEMEINGQTQTAGIGSYCWPDQPDINGNIPVVCVDIIGLPTPIEPVSTTSPVRANFSIPITQPVRDLSLTVHPVAGTAPVLRLEDDGLLFWQPGPGQRYVLPHQSPPTIGLDLEPGLYVFAVFGSWTDLGDASYGFLVEVTG